MRSTIYRYRGNTFRKKQIIRMAGFCFAIRWTFCLSLGPWVLIVGSHFQFAEKKNRDSPEKSASGEKKMATLCRAWQASNFTFQLWFWATWQASKLCGFTMVLDVYLGHGTAHFGCHFFFC